jgi:hypothetical protein
MSKNIRFLSHRQGLKNNLFTALAEAMQENPPATKPALDQLAEQARLSTSVLKDTASFYDFLNEQDEGRQTLVCQGTASLVNGSSAKTTLAYPEAGKAMCCGYCYQGSGLLQRDKDGLLHSCHQGETAVSQPPMPVYTLSPTAILTSAVTSIEALGWVDPAA